MTIQNNPDILTFTEIFYFKGCVFKGCVFKGCVFKGCVFKGCVYGGGMGKSGGNGKSNASSLRNLGT